MNGKFVEPEGWPRGRGYAHGVVREGTVLALAGQIGWNPRTQQMAPGGFVAQAKQALANIAELLRAADAKPEHLVRVKWYITGLKQYRDAQKLLGEAWREQFGSYYPAMTVVVVAALLEPGALVEIEATAVIG